MKPEELPAWKKILIGVLFTGVAVAGFFVYAYLSKTAPVPTGWGFILILFLAPLFGFLYSLFVNTKKAKNRTTLLIAGILVIGIIISLGPTLMGINYWGLDLIVWILLYLTLLGAGLFFLVYPVICPLTEEELADPKSREVSIHLPYDQAYQICLRSLQTLHFSDILSSDPTTGSIFAGVGAIRIRFSVRKISSSQTEIIITGNLADANNFQYIESRTRAVIRTLDKLKVFLSNHQNAEKEYSYGENNCKELLHTGSCEFSKSVPVAALLSLLIPGLGQSYNGKFVRGFGFMIATAAGLVAFILPGIVIWVYGIYDTYTTTREINEGRIPYAPVNGCIMLVHFLAGLALVVFSVMLFVILYWGAAGVQMITVALGGSGY